MSIELDKFMENLEVVHLPECTDLIDAIGQMVQNNYLNGVSYDTKISFKALNSGILEINDDKKYIFRHTIERSSDIVGNIRSNIKDIDVNICSSKISVKNLNVAICCMMYHKCVVEFYIDQDEISEDFFLKYTNIVLPNNMRGNLRSCKIVSKNITYQDGDIFVSN